MAAVVALSLLALAPSASAHTQTFSGGAPLSFGEMQASPYPSTLNVDGMPGTLSDVNVTLTGVNLTATNLDMVLVAPNGMATLLTSDVPTTVLGPVSWTFDDEASTSQETNQVTGVFKPTNVNPVSDSDVLPGVSAETDNTLGILDGADPNGPWKLYAADSGVAAPIGSIGGWSLELTTIAGIGQAAPASTDFGSVTVGQSSPLQTFTITNVGDAAMTIFDHTINPTDLGSPADASNFTLGADTCIGQALLPAATCTVQVGFSPLSSGVKKAFLLLGNEGGGGTVINLTGTALDPLLPQQPGGNSTPPPAQEQGPPPGTGSPNVTVSQAQFTSPPALGQPTTLHVEASDDKEPVTGVLIDFGEKLGLYGASGCVEGMKPGDAVFDIPYTFLTPGQHTIKITVFAGGCGKSSARTTSFDVVVNTPAAARRVATMSDTIAAPQVVSRCKNASMLPSTKKNKLIVKAVLCVINEQRKLYKLKPLKLNKKLGKAAVAHTKAMISGKFFAHQGPKEKNLAARLKKVKYRGAAGENIGAGGGPLGSPVGMVNGWMHSSLHRANILEKKWRTVGIGFLAKFPLPSTGAPVATFTTDFGSAKR
jgi:uncharacterized protein YkwD